MKIREAQKFSKDVVKLLTKKRKEQNLSRYKISKICDITEVGLGYIEKLERNPTLYSLKMIASSLGVKLSDIIKEIEDKEELK